MPRYAVVQAMRTRRFASALHAASTGSKIARQTLFLQAKLPEPARTNPFRKAPAPLHRCGSDATACAGGQPTYRTLDAAAARRPLSKRWDACSQI